MADLVLSFGRARLWAGIAAAVFAVGVAVVLIEKLPLPWAVLWLSYGTAILIRFLRTTRKTPGTHASHAIFDLKGFFTAIPEFVVPIVLLFMTSDGFQFQPEDIAPAVVGLFGALLGLIKRRPASPGQAQATGSTGPIAPA